MFWKTLSQTLFQYKNAIRACIFSTAIISISPTISSSSLNAQITPLPQPERWLEVHQIHGDVTYYGDRHVRDARIGDRLLQNDHGIDTHTQSDSILELDSGIGFVRMAENTRLRINHMAILPNGGRITSLFIHQGRARLQIRRFNNSNSELEIETPAGVAAVRGTIFGLNVDETGKTGVASLSGVVELSAQGDSVYVNPGFAASVLPGEPPIPAQPIDYQLNVDIETIQRTSSQVILRGRVNPTNSILIDGNYIEVNIDGSFQTVLFNSPRDYFGSENLSIRVRNPLGEIRDHQIMVPEFRSR